jgi:glycosyltransferase involved in cell wall biosynthesis
MRIVIDLQAAQLLGQDALLDGQALAFARSVLEHRGEHEILVALNGGLPDTIETIRSVLDDVADQANIVVWHAPTANVSDAASHVATRAVAGLIRAFFLTSLAPDALHVDGESGTENVAIVLDGPAGVPCTVMQGEKARLGPLGAFMTEIAALPGESGARAAFATWASLRSSTALATENVVGRLLEEIAVLSGLDDNPAYLCRVAGAIGVTFPPHRPARRLLLDATATCRVDLKTGIQRVVRALMLALYESPPVGYVMQPVYLSDEGGSWHYRYAKRFMAELLGRESEQVIDEVVEPEVGDVVLGLDLSGQILTRAERSGLFRYYRNQGARMYFVVHDLLPIRMPQYFPSGVENGFQEWLQAIATLDGAICVTQAVADDLAEWRRENAVSVRGRRPYFIASNHLGADVGNSAPSKGLPSDAPGVVAALRARPSFLAVGTIEPRKAYAQILDAFEQLWQAGEQVNLVIVGKPGWKVDGLADRLRGHAERGKRLFWLEGVSDEYLEQIYSVATCLIAASWGEGFGLPLIEAAQHRVPILARDIPVFREVAGENAYYFEGVEALSLAQAVREWLALNTRGAAPQSAEMPFKTWRQSADSLARILFPVAGAHNARA